MRNILTTIFVASVILLSFAAGAAVVSMQVFPYPIIRDARIALGAWKEALEVNYGGGASLPKGLERFEAAPASHTSAGAEAPASQAGGDGLILISGGPYQLMDRCPRFGCMAWLMDRSGRIVHVWEVDLDALWSGHLAPVGYG